MRSITRVTSKGRRRPKHSDHKHENQNPRRMSTKALIAEAEHIVARQAHLNRPEASSLAFNLVMLGVPVQSIELPGS